MLYFALILSLYFVFLDQEDPGATAELPEFSGEERSQLDSVTTREPSDPPSCWLRRSSCQLDSSG